ncbi:hypothetical protein ABK040_009005 [Willaertia magna]
MGWFWESKKPCQGARQDLIDCVMKYSECIKKPGTTFTDCIKPEVFPSECQNERERLNLCRRSLVDRRYRLRGTTKLEQGKKKNDDEDELDLEIPQTVPQDLISEANQTKEEKKFLQQQQQKN